MPKIITQFFLSFLSIALGAVFLYSAYTKLWPIQTFEYTLVEFANMPWWLAAVASRVFIGLETALGILFIANIYGSRKWVLQISLLLLGIFSVYLVYLWSTVGNDVNCGCFGDAIWMSPLSSLIKNAVMIAVTIILWKYNKGLQQKWSQYAGIALFIVILALPLFVFPIPGTQPSFLNKDKYKIDLSALYNSEKNPPPAVELRKGKHIIAFMSLTCPHCKIAAYKMQLMKQSNPDISMFLVLNGDSTNLQPFWDKTGAKSIPNTMLLGRDFVNLSGISLPAIYWINDSWVEAQSTYIDLSQSEIEKWLATPPTEQ